MYLPYRRCCPGLECIEEGSLFIGIGKCGKKGADVCLKEHQGCISSHCKGPEDPQGGRNCCE